MTDCTKCIHEHVCDQASRLLWATMGKEDTCSDFKDRAEYVEVVRCKDCKFSIPVYQKNSSKLEGTLHCLHGRGYQMNAPDREYSFISPNNFCGSGRRKMDGDVNA